MMNIPFQEDLGQDRFQIPPEHSSKRRGLRTARTFFGSLAPLLFVFILGAQLSSAWADQVRRQDGPTEQGLLIHRPEGLSFQDSKGVFYPLPWERLESVTYAFPRLEGDFAEVLDVVPAPNAERPAEPPGALRARLWSAAYRQSNSLPERQRAQFLRLTPQGEMLAPLQRIDRFLTSSYEDALRQGHSSEAAETCYLRVLLGYRFLETSHPAQFELGLQWIEQGLEQLGPVFEAGDSESRDWNILFAANRLYHALERFEPAFPKNTIELFREELARGGVNSSKLEVDPFGPIAYAQTAEAYIRHSHAWIRESSNTTAAEVLRRRQKELARYWVFAQQPGISRADFFQGDRLQKRWKRINALADVAYLTAESLLFKRTGQRLDPGVQTNMPPRYDPFTGRFYTYIQTEGRDFIFSVGPDQTSQEAKVPWIPGSASEAGDIFLLSPPAP